MAISHVLSNPVAQWTGTVTVFNSQGSTTTVAATNLVRPPDWNSVHNEFYTLSGNTTNASTASGTNVVFSAAGPSLTLGGSTGTIVFSTPPNISSLENFIPSPFTTLTLDGASNSHAVAFKIAEPISVSFMRVPVSMTTNSTTIATTAATLSASAEIYSTWNAVIYSLGTGANSKSLTSVASGSNGWTFRNSISVAANGTQYSVTQGFSANAEGAGTTRTTQYSISNTNYSLSTNQIATEWSGGRFIDIPMATSFSAGDFWAIFGYSSSSNTNSGGFAPATNCNVKYSNHYGVTQGSGVSFGVMGSTNLTSGGLLGAGSFSTAGGGTTAALPMSAISSLASYGRPYFQMLRSA